MKIKTAFMVLLISLTFVQTGFSYDIWHYSSLKRNIERFIQTKECNGCYLAGANFRKLNLTGAQLNRANLEGANFKYATLTGVGFNGANLNKAFFEGARWIDGVTTCLAGSRGFCLAPKK